MKLLGNLICCVLIVLLFEICDSAQNKQKKRNKGQRRGKGRCNDKFLAEYNLTFYGDWSPRIFTKDYPKYRPPAQWSKLIGRSHDTTYSLWSMGEQASPALRQFAERADSALLDEDAQAYWGIFDSFSAASIESGMGRSAVRFLADGDHSKMSFIVKLIPSPDWFVGVQALDLCLNRHWRKEVTIDLQPIDAGTDKGFTFTSPNWRSDPQVNISFITSQIPNHPASSFYYENMENLPRIGHVVITKVAEYKRKGKLLELPPTEPNVIIFDDGSGSGMGNEAVDVHITQTTPMTPNDANVDNSKQDCLVTEWTEWSPCSRTCGFGVKSRHREAFQMPGPGGLGCPALNEQLSCGSMRNCKWKHFGSLFRRDNAESTKTD
ncbi:hypothetical protein ScPMuIL_000711 [Solemya velum]